MVAASGVGSHPGDDDVAFAEALALATEETVGLPYLPELPGRGPAATMTGRAVALLSGMAVDLQPAGWRLTTAAGVDQRRAVSLLRQDLDRLEERCAGHTGPVKIQVVGPWTLAATVERPRGDRVLADHGARRDLAQSLAEGLRDHLPEVVRRTGAAPLVLQVDEPALPAVLGGAVPTASGLHRHRSVDLPEAAAALEAVLGAAGSAAADAVVHCCAAQVPFELLERAGAPGVSVDLDVLDGAGLDGLARALESGRRVHLGVVPARRPATEPTTESVVARVERVLDMLGLEPTPGLALTPSCGLAGADRGWARAALAVCRTAAQRLS